MMSYANGAHKREKVRATLIVIQPDKFVTLSVEDMIIKHPTVIFQTQIEDVQFLKKSLLRALGIE